ncbi:MAG: glycosyltransferase [Alphaproteobacteria bacterium]|nr:glycosyltransferase [Alphaproteobacteria bacterium]
MRILQAMAGGERGGAEAFFVWLCRSLAGRGIDQRAVLRPHSAREAALRDAGVDAVAAAFGGPLDLFTPRTLRREIEHFRPDIVITWMSRATAFCPAASPGHRFLHLGAPTGYYDPKYYRRCGHLMVTTADLKRFFVESGWVDARVSVIPHFIPDRCGAPASRAAFETPEDAPLLLALGRLHETKGFDVLLEAMRGLTSHYLWIGGSGPLEGDLKQRAIDLGVGDRVRFLGWRDDTPSLFAAADVFVCSSRRESFGLMVVEAWMHRVPIVAAAAEGPADLIDHGVNGLLVPKEESAALAGTISRLARDSALARRLVASGRDTYERVYAEDAGCRRYIELFEGLTASRPGHDNRQVDQVGGLR